MRALEEQVQSSAGDLELQTKELEALQDTLAQKEVRVLPPNFRPNFRPLSAFPWSKPVETRALPSSLLCIGRAQGCQHGR